MSWDENSMFYVCGKFALIHILLPDGKFLRCLIIKVTVVFQATSELEKNCYPISPALYLEKVPTQVSKSKQTSWK